MSINKEVWISTIEENLYPQSEFINYSMDFTAYVNNAVCHVPNAGALPTVTMNRNSFPAAVVSRVDQDLTFNLNEYSVAPVFIQFSEELEINYNKRESILYNMVEVLRQTIGNVTAYNWSPAAVVSGVTRFVKTTGAYTANALAPSATSVRSGMTLQDIASVKTILDADFVSDNDRFLMIPSAIYNNQLLQISELIELYKFGSATLPTGVINKIYGFNIMTRPQVSTYTSAATPVLETITGAGYPASPGATSNMAALAWHKGSVCSAKGETKVYFSEDRPEYFGSMFSAVVRQGATIIRSDGKGVAVIIQSN